MTCGAPILPADAIRQIIDTANGKVSYYFQDISSGCVNSHEASVSLPSASLIKVPILACLLKHAEAGGINLKQAVPVKSQNIVGGSGIINQLPEDTKYTWETLARLMIVLSDNCATNEIIDLLGIERVQTFIGGLGLKETSLQRKMMDFEAIKNGKNNYTSARDMGKILAMLALGELGNDISRCVLAIMKRQLVRHLLPLSIPAVPADMDAEKMELPPKGSVLVANKTGDLGDKLHDVGLFLLPDGRVYVLAVMTWDLPTLNDGIAPISEISRLIYEAMTAGKIC